MDLASDVPAMQMRGMWFSRLSSALSVFVWGLFLVIGLDAMTGIAAQGAAGYPNDEQRTLYLYIPLIMATISLLLFAASWRLGRHGILGGLALLLLASAIPYLMVYGGGV